MKLLFLCLAALLLAVYVAVSLGLESGYVVIVREPRVIQVRLSAVIAGLIALFGTLYLLLRLIATIRETPRRAARWRRQRALNQSLAHAQSGYADFIGGNWERAEKKLLEAAAGNPAPLVSLLAAADAANQQGAFERRDHHIEQAFATAPAYATSIRVARLRMQVQARQYNEAWDTLTRLRMEAPKNLQVRLLGVELGRRNGRWKELLQMLPKLDAPGGLAPEQISQYESEAAAALFRACRNRQQLELVWKDLSHEHRRNPEVIESYVGALLPHGAGAEAAQILLRAIRRQWQPQLVLLYGRIKSGDDAGQYRIAEEWASRHPTDPALLLTLGRLARRNQLWGKARSYLETAAGGGDRTAAHELGSLLEELGEKDEAIECYRKALTRQDGDTASLPAKSADAAASLSPKRA